MTQDVRSHKVVVLAHCVLNQNSRVEGLARYPAVVKEVVDFLIKHDIGIVQMPCPEISYMGSVRKIRTKEQYDTLRFRSLCRQIACSTVRLIQEYLHNGVRVLAVLGVEGSPSCGVKEPSGILIEELKKKLEKRGITVPFHELNFKAIAADVKWLKKTVKA
jgi:predicted secreted protein